MNIYWLFYALLSTISYGFVNVFIKKCSNNDSKRLILSTFLLHYLICILASMIMGLEGLDKINLHIFLLIFLQEIFTIISIICGVLGVKYSKVSTASNIKKLKVIIPIFLGIFLLNEKFNAFQIFFSIIVLITTFLLSKIEEKDTKSNSKLGLSLCWGFAIFGGLIAFTNKLIVNEFSYPFTISFYQAIVGFTLFMIYIIFTNSFKYLNFNKLKNEQYFYLKTIFDVAASIFLSFALVYGNLSFTNVISACSIIITLFLSRIYLKERISLNNYLLIIMGLISTISIYLVN